MTLDPECEVGDLSGEVTSNAQLSVGRENPDEVEFKINVALLAAAFLACTEVGAPRSFEEWLAWAIRTGYEGPPGGALDVAVELGKIKHGGLLRAFAGGTVGIWTKVQCHICKCSWFGWGPPRWAKNGSEKWVACDLTKTETAQKPPTREFVLDWDDDIPNLARTVFFVRGVSKEALAKLFSECESQALESCKEDL